MSMLSMDLTIEYPDGATAKAVFSAVDPENKGYVEGEVRENLLIFKMEASSAGSLRNTADDLLACIKVAEETVGIVRQ